MLHLIAVVAVVVVIVVAIVVFVVVPFQKDEKIVSWIF
jgi:hypothetical protein